MHKQVMEFMMAMREARPESFMGRVLECGSLNVNGTAKFLFAASEYIGIDACFGAGVDQVSLVHEWDGKPDGYFDTVVSTEMLEHDPYWRESIRRMVDFVRPGGSLIVTYAGQDRPEHEKWASPESGYYYSPPVTEAFEEIASVALFRYMLTEVRETPSDVYMFFAGKIG